MIFRWAFTALLFGFLSCSPATTGTIKIEQWAKHTLAFTGPETGEASEDNPFLNYRLMVTFVHSDKTIVIPGFYAADGQAATTGASEGSVWKVHFRPDLSGEWTYTVSFRKGDQIALSKDPEAGMPVSFDGESGNLSVIASDLPGRVGYVGKRYLQYSGSGDYFLKGGADSPENFLAYVDFDGTVKQYEQTNRAGEAPPTDHLHAYAPHKKDWREGDPVWRDSLGKSIIGALNYLSSKEMNVVYFLTMNIEGDGKDVYPYTAYNERQRFDCSKLDQWEIVFDHMDRLGIMLHIVTQETENELLLDNGETGPDRKLYYRELIARFAHHPLLVWNMGEENGPAHWTPNGQTIAQREQMIAFFQENDPYNNAVVIHSHSDKKSRDELFHPHLGNPDLEGMSMQVGDKTNIHEVTKYWVKASEEAGHPWVMNMDEIGRHWRGVDPDDREDNNQDSVRQYALWGNLMAGGGGVEWYFGYRNHNNDLGCEDWTTRDRMWDYTRNALTFFRTYLPFWDMDTADELISSGGEAYGFAKEDEVYAFYLLEGGESQIDLTASTETYSVSWYDPRNGGELLNGNITEVNGGELFSPGLPPNNATLDWVLLMKKQD